MKLRCRDTALFTVRGISEKNAPKNERPQQKNNPPKKELRREKVTTQKNSVALGSWGKSKQVCTMNTVHQ
jgi:hypothetical protein